MAGVVDRWIPNIFTFLSINYIASIGALHRHIAWLRQAQHTYTPFLPFNTDAASCSGRQIPTPSLLFQAIWTLGR